MTEEQKKHHTQHVIDTIAKHFKELTSFKGVTGAGAGFRMQNGKLTDEICVNIQVEKKIPRHLLKDDEVIPARMGDITVNVTEKPTYILHDLVIPIKEAENKKEYRPLKGGSQITNGLQSPPGSGLVSVGTLGCMVHLPIKKYPFNALLSNYHVMYAHGGGVGQAIGQPSLSSGTVGKVHGGKEWGTEVDIALASLAEGVACTNEVLVIGTLTGFGDAYVGQYVQKYGRTTEHTEGQITNVNIWVDSDPPIVVYLGLEIKQGYPEINPTGKFSDHGDSGSVIVNADNKVVGLLWGGNSAVPKTTFANDQRRLRQVEGEFTIPVPTTYQTQHLFSDSQRLAQYGEQLKRTEHGKAIWEAFAQHIPEGTDLINKQRECMVAWQRYKGCAFVSLTKDSDPKAQAPYPLARAIDGVALEDMITKIMEVFKKNGSQSLKDAIAKHGDELLSYVRQSGTVEEIVGLIADAKRGG